MQPQYGLDGSESHRLSPSAPQRAAITRQRRSIGLLLRAQTSPIFRHQKSGIRYQESGIKSRSRFGRLDLTGSFHQQRTMESSNALPPHMRPERSFQGLILALERYWADWGCVILQPYDMEVGAGTFHPATTLRALGPKPWNAAYVQPSRRPKDGRYGENPNRLQHYYQLQVILKPSPDDLQELYLKSLYAIGIDPKLHDIRFVEDDWESPTLGAWGLGWECWCDGMEVSQFTYFQQVAGFECAPVAGELTYGLERLAMYVQGVDRVYDLNFNGRDGDKKVTYGDVFLQAEQEYSRHNFEFADTDMLFEQFKRAEAACRKYIADGWETQGNARVHLMALPAYDQCIKASHVFNLLDARGVISVTERQSYILRVRELAKACGEAWLATEAGGGGA